MHNDAPPFFWRRNYMSATEVRYADLASLVPHPDKSSLAIQCLMAGATVLCFIALVLVWHDDDVEATPYGLSDTASTCRLVALPNSGVPYQAGYQCPDGSILFPGKPVARSG